MKYLIILITILSANLAYAQEMHKTYEDWSLYTIRENGQKLCYTTSFPVKKSGNYRSRSKPYVMVTFVENGDGEISVTGGYQYKKNTEPRIRIDNNTYKISLTKGEMAWAKTDHYDRMLINKMKKGWKMQVTGTSIKGSYSIDTYSLKGFANAYDETRKLCNGSSA